MRLLSLDINRSLINKLENDELYICDRATDMEDAIYHCEVRYYNLIIIKSDSYNNLRQILKHVNPRLTAVVILSNNSEKKFEKNLLRYGALSIIKEPANNELILAKLESIHRENFQRRFMFKDKYWIDTLENSVTDHNNNKLVMKGKPFSILMYLIKNRHRPSISKDEILDVIWDDPEWVVKNVVEVNINIIRKGIKNTFEDNFINTIRHRGYQVT
ncbi:winged helix-turn-helix transcriptional regulator [Arcobacter roscoffensis]|uniref:Winged helix-turn-helix domain-containing protein n=1 Tax=Arcobacter roscoffensis TaxID=2961520 RepID=A0ABY5E371_9BACT|nr:winged helix-turn-helix domain-containing protein [Arcobacter roscoffensis]UTJ05563.1 winged helix-turn-helix domain-containing protein [Arcobacter roscoffensis]